MSRKQYRYRKRTQGEIVESGQDSFLDIVSNVVGILIILVMIAGVQVGAVHTTQPQENITVSKEVPAEQLDNRDDNELSRQEMLEYVQAGKDVIETRQKILKQQQETQERDQQLVLTRQRANGAEIEHQKMIENLSRLEAMVELEARKKGEAEKKNFDRHQELIQVTAQANELQKTRDSLTAAKPKTKILENVPTALAKKVEGHEGYFCIRQGKISHVPVNPFLERIRRIVSGLRDVKQTVIDQTDGPIEQYFFHFRVSIRHVQDFDKMTMSVDFEFGEYIPAEEQIGETPDIALANGSKFISKLAVYLRETSTITLFVYPDSFEELRRIKKYLIEQGYSIALRPMPTGQNITISPYGSASTSY